MSAKLDRVHAVLKLVRDVDRVADEVAQMALAASSLVMPAMIHAVR